MEQIVVTNNCHLFAIVEIYESTKQINKLLKNLLFEEGADGIDDGGPEGGAASDKYHKKRK